MLDVPNLHVKDTDVRIKKIRVLLLLIVFSLVICFDWEAKGFPVNRINSIPTIISDMQPPHQGTPHGVPSTYDWVRGPRIGMGNHPKDFKAMIAWGQLYESAEGNPAANSRVQIRNIKAYLLSKRDRHWHLLQSSQLVEGDAFREDYAGNASQPASVRDEAEGGISVKVGQGSNFHFWTKGGRATIDPKDVNGIFTTVQARLIVDDPKHANDLVRARYLLSMGGDYWLNLTAKWDNFGTNDDIAIGKFKYVTPDWQAFNMTTLTVAQIRQNPPPIE